MSSCVPVVACVKREQLDLLCLNLRTVYPASCSLYPFVSPITFIWLKTIRNCYFEQMASMWMTSYTLRYLAKSTLLNKSIVLNIMQYVCWVVTLLKTPASPQKEGSKSTSQKKERKMWLHYLVVLWWNIMGQVLMSWHHYKDGLMPCACPFTCHKDGAFPKEWPPTPSIW